MTIDGPKYRSAILLTLLVVSGCGGALPERAAPDATELGSEQEPGREQELALERAHQLFENEFMEQSCDRIAPSQNEVHDCQRLVRLDTLSTGPQPMLEFGPLIGILPEQDVLALDATAYQGTPQAVALISNAGSLSGDDAYPPLGIAAPAEGDSTSTYCLWMMIEADDWRASMKPTATAGGSDCGEAPDVRTGNWDSLTVVRQTYGEVADTTLYPATARWQWTGEGGDRNGVHFIGIRCALGWCSVLPPGASPPAMPQPDSLPPTRAIPGWHDAQFLGVMRRVPVAGQPPDSILVPGPWGVIYPEPVPPTDHPDWRWGVRVASFELTPVPGGGFGRYTSKVNARSNGRSWAVLSWDGDPNQGPAVQYRNAQGVAEADTVITAPFRHGPAMSARWRWRETDETAWMPCPYYGCCDVEEGRF